jgi:uncharacterized protein involved in exopolysaccharide biosynthesis
MKFTLRDVLNVLFRYSPALITLWLVVVIGALVFYSQAEKRYESRSKILVSMGTESLGRAAYADAKNLQLLQREEQLHNEQQILQSQEVAATAARWILGDATPGSPAPPMDARLAQARRFLTGEEPPPTLLLRFLKAAGQMFASPAKGGDARAKHLKSVQQQLSKGLAVNAIFDSDALDVRFSYRDPQVAQTLLNLIIKAYLDHHIAVFQSNKEAELLKSQLDQSVGQYHRRLADFSSFMNAHQVYNDDTQVNLLVEQQQKLKQALDQAVADGDARAARMASLKAIADSLHEFERYSTTEVRNKQREALLAKLNDASLEEQALLARHPKESRAYQEEQAKLDEIRRLLQQEPENVVDQTEQRKSKAAEFVESEMISVTEMQRGDEARVERMRSDLQHVDSELQQYAASLNGFNSLKMDLNLAKQESEQMAQLYTDSRLKTLTSQNAITNVSIIDTPTLEPDPASPNKLVALAGTLVVLILGSFGLLFASIGLDTTVADRTTANLRLGVPIAGTIPMMRGDTNGKDFAEVFVRSNYAEFSRIYQALSEPGPSGKVILVAESGPKEGCSLIGYGLASFLATYACQRTAFVDKTPNPLSDAPRYGERPGSQAAVIPWDQMAGGEMKLDAEPAISKLRQEFAYVVVAAGAVKDATALLRLSPVVSAVLFIVEANKTRRATASYNLELLRQYGFKHINVILNKRVFYIPSWLMRFV